MSYSHMFNPPQKKKKKKRNPCKTLPNQKGKTLPNQKEVVMKNCENAKANQEGDEDV